jgi:hypothetical protein
MGNPPQGRGSRIFVTIANGLTIVNNATEQNLYVHTVPGNMLGSNNLVQITAYGYYIQNSVGTPTIRLKVYYGATEVWQDLSVSLVQDAGRRVFRIDILLFADGTANAQIVFGTCTGNGPGGANTGHGNVASDEQDFDANLMGIDTTENSTLDKDLKITGQFSVADPLLEMRIRKVIVQLFQS